MELVTEEIPPDVRGRLTPEGARWVLGQAAASATDHVPLILLPGYEYRLRELGADRHEGEVVWIIERRAVGTAE